MCSFPLISFPNVSPPQAPQQHQPHQATSSCTDLHKLCAKSHPPSQQGEPSPPSSRSNTSVHSTTRPCTCTLTPPPTTSSRSSLPSAGTPSKWGTTSCYMCSTTLWHTSAMIACVWPRAVPVADVKVVCTSRDRGVCHCAIGISLQATRCFCMWWVCSRGMILGPSWAKWWSRASEPLTCNCKLNWSYPILNWSNSRTWAQQIQ